MVPCPGLVLYAVGGVSWGSFCRECCAHEIRFAPLIRHIVIDSLDF
jgi:hypothetical protein